MGYNHSVSSFCARRSAWPSRPPLRYAGPLGLVLPAVAASAGHFKGRCEGSVLVGRVGWTREIQFGGISGCG
jgi:hypothetical protein